MTVCCTDTEGCPIHCVCKKDLMSIEDLIVEWTKDDLNTPLNPQGADDLLKEAETELRRLRSAASSEYTIRCCAPESDERIACLMVRVKDLEERLARSEETVRMGVDTARSLQDRLEHLAETKDRRELALEQRIERYMEALRLISAVPAFPSKDIADRALGTQVEWEPKAVKEYRERKDGQ